jgi:hypothetical protein
MSLKTPLCFEARRKLAELRSLNCKSAVFAHKQYFRGCHNEPRPLLLLQRQPRHVILETVDFRSDYLPKVDAASHDQTDRAVHQGASSWLLCEPPVGVRTKSLNADPKRN